MFAFLVWRGMVWKIPKKEKANRERAAAGVKKAEKSMLVLQKSTQLALVDNFKCYIVASYLRLWSNLDTEVPSRIEASLEVIGCGR